MSMYLIKHHTMKICHWTSNIYLTFLKKYLIYQAVLNLDTLKTYEYFPSPVSFHKGMF
jgi:uncharacterized membrane protein